MTNKHPPLSVNLAEGHARVDAADYAHEAYLFNKDVARDFRVPRGAHAKIPQDRQHKALDR